MDIAPGTQIGSDGRRVLVAELPITTAAEEFEARQGALYGGGGVSADALPWTIDVDAFHASGHTNWNTITAIGTAAHAAVIEASGAQNAERYWDLGLAAGTWDIELMFLKLNSNGIITVSLDATTVGTIDTYSASQVNNFRAAIAGVVVAADGKQRLKLKMATKNASSSGYTMYLQHIQLRRTA